MSSMSNIREGMRVYSADEQLVGTVEGVRGGMLLVNGQQIPGDAIARVAQGRIYLKAMGTRMPARSSQQATGEIHIPVAEERLSVEKRAAELGEVRLRKTVVEEQQTIPVELRREEVYVEQRNVTDRPVQPGDQVFQEGTIRVPVRGEEAVVSKEAVVTGEVVLDKEQTVERQQVTDTVRREQVEVEESQTRTQGQSVRGDTSSTSKRKRRS